MRVLIIAAVLAFASAAPSGVIAPVPALIPAATIDPGDIEAAAINAKVFAEDQAIAAIDKARELKELAIEDQNEKVAEVNDLVKEKNEEAFWSVEDKKWQALDAVKTAEAQLDGSVASNAEAIARSAYSGVIVPTYIASVPQVVSPIVYAAPGVIAPGVIAPAKIEEAKLVKTAEAEKTEEVKTEKVEEVKAEKVEEANAEPEKKAEPPLEPVYTPLALAPAIAPGLAPAIKLGEPWVAPVAYIPQYSAVQHIPTPLLAPALIKQW